MKSDNILILVFLCFIQCTSYHESNNWNECKIHEDIKFEEITYPDILGISMQLVKIDSLLLINDFHGDTLINVFNLNSHTIEKKLISKGEGPNELISPLDIQMMGHNLYIQCRPKFSLNHIKISEILNSQCHLFQDALLPQKSDRFLPLSDSLFIFSGLWDKRYALLDLTAHNEIKEFGEYPDYWSDEKDIPTNAKAMFHQCRFIKHPQKNLFASCSSHVLEVYDYTLQKRSLPKLIWKKQLGRYSYNFTSGNYITVSERPGTDPKVLELACTEDHIYVVIESKDKNKCNIIVFDWEGNALKILNAPKKITCLIVDEKSKRGYCIIEDPNDKLVFFNLHHI